MARDTRRQMIDGAIELLARGGLAQTSFATVLDRSGAPRGSIYHHFPDGKDQLVLEAVTASGERSIAMIRAWRGEPATVVAERFLGAWRYLLTATDFDAGCAVAAVATGADAAGLVDAAGDVFRSWRDELASLLSEGGLAPDRADGAATFLIAAAEGAVILGRATRRIEDFDSVAAEVRARVEALLPRE